MHLYISYYSSNLFPVLSLNALTDTEHIQRYGEYTNVQLIVVSVLLYAII